MRIPTHPRILLLDYPVAPQFRYDMRIAEIARVKKAAQALLDENNGITKTRRKIRSSFTTGLLTMGGLLEQHGYDVVYGSALQGLSERLLQQIDWADVILLTAMTPIYPFVRQVARQIKARAPQKILVIGGYHVSALPEEVLREEQAFDAVVIGEGERPILELLQQPVLQAGLPGTVIRHKNIPIFGPPSPLLPGPEIPSPNYNLLPGNRSAYRYNIQTVRGCPKRCGYCVNGFFWQTVRRRPTESLIEELRDIEATLGPKAEIHITDNILTVSTRWLRDLVEAYEQSGLSLQFTADVKAEYIDEERVKLMKRLQVKKVYMGFEDADDTVRQSIHRQGTLVENIDAIECIKRHSDIIVEGYWMLGLPGTNPAVMRQNISTAVELLRSGLLQTVCSDVIFVPLPGSPLFHEADKYGIKLLHRNWEDYHRSQYLPVYELETVTRTQLREYFIAFEESITKVYLEKLGLDAHTALDRYEQLVSGLESEIEEEVLLRTDGGLRWGNG